MSNTAAIKVSIVIPLYEKAAYIRRAIESVLAQTHENFEVIVIDDGSTDGGGDIVRRFTDPRIRMIVQRNAGKCVARNCAIKQTSSDLVAFLDADDEWMPDFLETVLALREKFPEAATWGTAYTEITPQGQLRNFQPDEETRRRPDGLLINFFRFSLQVQQPCNASSTMMRKDALLKAGGFPEGLTRLGDTDTLFRMALRYPMAYCPVPKAIYHMEAENRSAWYLHSGNYPFFRHAREYLAESPDNRLLDEDVKQYLAFHHTQSLCPNWLTGNRAAMREIIGDCGGITGYRLTCLCWRALSWIPYPLVRLSIKLRRRIARLLGRSGGWPPLRSIYRACSIIPSEGQEMQTNTKVSVVIPLYNKARYIQRAIESVLAQTHRNFELIVVDDGSTDGSAEIVRRFTDPRIRLIVQENVGECATRNRGVQEATTDVVAFVDADDEWLPEFLETVLALRQKFPQAGVWATAYAAMTPGGQLKHFEPDEETRRQTDGLLVNFFRFSVEIQQPFNASSTMVSKEALLKAGGFPVGLARLGDTDTFFRLALRYPIAYCPRIGAVYHMEAEDRTDAFVYSGVFPFFRNARAFRSECGQSCELSEDMRQYLGFYHTSSLYDNWRAGNRAAIREITRDCREINVCRCACLRWTVLSWIPYPLVKLYIKLRSRMARFLGRTGETARPSAVFTARDRDNADCFRSHTAVQ